MALDFRLEVVSWNLPMGARVESRLPAHLHKFPGQCLQIPRKETQVSCRQPLMPHVTACFALIVCWLRTSMLCKLPYDFGIA